MFVSFAISPLLACTTVATEVFELDIVNVPATFACSLNVPVFPNIIVPVVADNVIVGFILLIVWATQLLAPAL